MDESPAVCQAVSPAVLRYSGVEMPEEAFYERFKRVLNENEISFEVAASTMGTSVDVIRRLCDGRTKQAKFDEALKLCDRFGIDPWYLAFGRSRAMPTAGTVVESGLELVSQADLQSVQSEIDSRLEKIEAALKKLGPRD